MKTTLQFLFIIATVFLSMSACKKKSSGNLLNGTKGSMSNVEFPYTKSKTIDDSISAFPLSIPVALTDTFATQVDQFLSTYGLGITRDKIIRIAPIAMNVTIDNATAQTLDFVNDSVKVYVDAYNGNNPRLVATKYGILPGAKSITFDVINTDVKDYFNNPYMQFSLKFNTKPNHGMLAATTFIVNIKFGITANE